MFCPKCGKPIPDGSRFCSICGEKLNNSEPVVTVENRKKAVTVIKPKTVSGKGMPNLKKYIPIAAAVVGIAVLVLLVCSLFSGGGKAEYAYLAGGRYYLLSDLKDGDPLELAAAKSDSVRAGMLQFSPDGKYVYYLTKYDGYSETGTLCRAQLDKLKDNPDKNEKYIEILAANVCLGFDILEDGSLLYMTGDNSLHYHNGKDNWLIARDVEEYYTGSKQLIYCTGDYWEGYSIYGVDLKDPENREKLDANVSYLYNTWDLENILYVKDDENGYNLYTGGVGKESQLLDKNVFMMGRRDGMTWYLTEMDTALSLYDFVQDDYAAADAGLSEPLSENFELPAYTYKKVYGSDLKEENFPELYTSITKELTWFQSGWWYYSMEEAREMDWGENTEGLKNAIDIFITKHGSKADENGYIKVTPEVKADLLQIQNYAQEPEEQWQWMWLCYSRQQTGTYTDWDAYNAAWAEWNDAKNRIELRELLNNSENDRMLYVLKSVEAGKSTVISENILSYEQQSNGLVFNTPDMVTEKLPLEELDYISQVKDLFQLHSDGENQAVILSSNKLVSFSSMAADGVYIVATTGGLEGMYFTEDYVYIREGNNTLYQASVTGGQIGSFTILSDDAEVVGMKDDVLYYISGRYTNNGYEYCELYALEKGKQTRLAKDIIARNINLYEDGTILAYTDSRSGFELTMINEKGESKLICENVSSYVRVDKNTLLILSEGDLFCYNGKTRQRVAVNVEQLWTLEKMEIKATFFN